MDIQGEITKMSTDIVNKKSKLWQYLPLEIRGLIRDGEQLVTVVDSSSTDGVSDYSYLVFPFAKAYEGFLKRLFLDLDMITEDAYYGERIRIGKILDPFYTRHEQSVYQKILRHKKGGRQISERLWRIWRHGRNQVFHYFPHNFRRLNHEEAMEIVREFISVMEAAVEVFALE